jgi:xylulokinase
MPVVIPELDEYVTKGAAMQAASALTGSFPAWTVAVEELPRVPVEKRIGQQHKAAMAALGYVT